MAYEELMLVLFLLVSSRLGYWLTELRNVLL